MKLSTFFSLSILLTSTATARIGETQPQCATRYGREITESKVAGGMLQRTYSKDGIDITICFLNSRAVSIHYTKKTTAEEETKPKFTKEEAMALFSLNSGSGAWDEVSADADTTLVRCDKLKLTGVHSSGVVYIETDSAAAATRKAKEFKAADKFKGL